jgi:hypothetical protein
MGADLIGFGCAEVGVERQGVLVVLTGAGWVGQDVVNLAEAGVGSGLLVAFLSAHRDRQPPAQLSGGPPRCFTSTVDG